MSCFKRYPDEPVGWKQSLIKCQEASAHRIEIKARLGHVRTPEVWDLLKNSTHTGWIGARIRLLGSRGEDVRLSGDLFDVFCTPSPHLVLATLAHQSLMVGSTKCSVHIFVYRYVSNIAKNDELNELSGLGHCFGICSCECVGVIPASTIKVQHFIRKFAWMGRLHKTPPRSSLWDRWVPELASLGKGS